MLLRGRVNSMCFLNTNFGGCLYFLLFFYFLFSRCKTWLTSRPWCDALILERGRLTDRRMFMAVEPCGCCHALATLIALQERNQWLPWNVIVARNRSSLAWITPLPESSPVTRVVGGLNRVRKAESFLITRSIPINRQLSMPPKYRILHIEGTRDCW